MAMAASSAALVACAAAQNEPAQDGPRPPRAEGAIVVTDGAALRSQPATVALLQMLHEARVLPPLERAWEELASTMGLQRAAAFDRLLGRRVAIFFEEPRVGATDWAVASQVDAPTEALVREKLRPAPRGFVAGAPVLALENGAFELAVPRDAGGVGLPTLILGPRQGALFDRLIPKGAVPPAPPERVGNARDVRGDVFAVYKRPGEGPVPDFAAATAWAQGLRWRVSYSGTRSLLIGGSIDDAHTPPAALTNPEAWARLSRDAALALVGQATPDIAGFGAVGAAWRQLIGDEQTPEPEGSSVAVVLHEPAGGSGWRLAFALPIKLGPGSTGDDRLALPARRGDAAIARAIRSVGGPGVTPPDFQGRHPGAIRIVGAPAASPGSTTPPDRGGTLLAGSRWAWSYVVLGDRGWWIVAISGPAGTPTPADDERAASGVRLLREALIGPEDHAPPQVAPRPDLFRFVARPEALVRGLVGIGMPEVGLVAAMRQAELIQWTCSPAAPGLAEGEITLDMRSPAQR
jgi:hypothetical protein